MNRRVLLGLVLIAVAGGGFTLKMLMASASPAVPVQSRQTAATPDAAPPKYTPTPSGPSWRRADREWLFNPRKGAAFEVPSLNRVAVWQGSVLPMLVVRCDAGHMQTFVYTGSAMQMEVQDENHTVRFRFDDEPERTERWSDDSDHSALFARDTAAFAARLTTARTLRFSYTPHNAATANTEFNVGGLSGLLQPAAKQCGLKK